MQNVTTISVVIPTFNRAELLGQAIDSVLRQTRPADEIIVVDDGSTEDIPAVLATRRGTQYLRQDNRGVSAARNTGMARATGDALLFLDSDDLLEPDALKKLAETLEACPDAAAVFCRATFITETGAPAPPALHPRALNDEAPDGDLWRQLLWSNCVRTTGVVLLRRAALESAGPWDETLRINEDWDLWLRLTESGAPFVRLTEPLLRYRVHGDGLTRNVALAHRTGLQLYEKHLVRLQNDPVRFPPLLCAYVANYAAFSESAGSPPMPEPWASRWRDYQAATGVTDPVAAFASGRDPRLQGRHAALRHLIERSGIAALYRKTPLALRLRLRSLFGVDAKA